MVMSGIEKYVGNNGRCVAWELEGDVISVGEAPIVARKRLEFCLERLMVKSFMVWNCLNHSICFLESVWSIGEKSRLCLWRVSKSQAEQATLSL